MVLEFIDAAVVGLDALALAPMGSNSSVSRPNTTIRAEPPIGKAAFVGAATGVFCNNAKQAALLSGSFGALVPLLSHGKHGMANIALSTATSTAVGLVAYEAKKSWVSRHENKIAATHTAEHQR